MWLTRLRSGNRRLCPSSAVLHSRDRPAPLRPDLFGHCRLSLAVNGSCSYTAVKEPLLEPAKKKVSINNSLIVVQLHYGPFTP